MSYEEIDKSVYGNDVFTNGAEGRYAKAKARATTDDPMDGTVKKSEKKKKAPKADAIPADNPPEPAAEGDSAPTEEKTKTKKKSRKVEENGEALNGTEMATAVAEAEGEATTAKPKKKKAPKHESNTENIDPVVPDGIDEPVKKKKSKAPKATTAEEDLPTVGDLESTTEPVPKVKKSKKAKQPKTTSDSAAENFDDAQSHNPDSMYNTTTADNGLYGETAYGDGALSQVVEPENVEPEKSDYESLITNAYNNLGSKINFAEFVGDDKWSIVHLPKSARIEPKSRIRKIIPGRKDDRADAKNQANRGKAPKSGFLTRIRTGVSSLVRDENNLLFGERSNYEAAYPEEDDEDGIDTDNLHREAQKLRELEDADKEINPEYIVIRNGKTIYGVHEADAEGKITLSTRKPIYDRAADQSVDPFDVGDRRTLLSRLRKPFNRNKDKDGKGENSPKSSTGTPDGNEKRRSKKSSKKTADEEMASKEPLED